MFWTQYRRTFVPAQLMIVAACLFFVFVGHVQTRALVRPLLVMEAAAVAGASMAARFKVAVERAEAMPRRAGR